MIRTYDIDGVLCMDGWLGMRPASQYDLIITGRSVDEEKETRDFLFFNGIQNEVYFNNVPFDQKTRTSSGHHKATVLNKLLRQGKDIVVHYEDDPLQAEIIRDKTPVEVILVQHSLINKENVKRDRYGHEVVTA